MAANTARERIQNSVSSIRAWSEVYNKRCDGKESKYFAVLMKAINKKEKMILKKIGH